MGPVCIQQPGSLARNDVPTQCNVSVCQCWLMPGLAAPQESVSEAEPSPADQAAGPASSTQAIGPTRPASPAPGASALAAQPLEDARTKLSLPPAVMRRAQQLPGAIPLPNGHQVCLCLLPVRVSQPCHRASHHLHAELSLVNP